MLLLNRGYRKFTIIISIIITLDQISKYILSVNYDYFINKSLFIFSFNYIRNYGAAFNIFEGNRIFLSLASILSSLILIYFIFFKEILNSINRYGLSFILAGSIGNGIDRILKGYVIDFINLNIIDFPIFNIADISINIGCILLIFNYFKNKK
tara:strand:+ start:179 stop:637 length:459 start_codon:yes stop_codon:yes gene_type:complete